jgi:hypothetical protein
VARTLKSQGREELGSLLRRVRRQLAMSRISRHDATFIEERLLEVDKRICAMDELNEFGQSEEISENGIDDQE